MVPVDQSPLGYLSRTVNNNKSPLVNLTCGNHPLSNIYKKWNSEELQTYLFYKKADRLLDGLFAGVIFSPQQMSSKRYLDPLFIGFTAPADKADWLEWKQLLFMENHNLLALYHTVSENRNLVSQVDVWVTLPYPEIRQTNFGKIEHRLLDFQSVADRISAVQWWISNFLNEWKRQDLDKHLRLRGFRWGSNLIWEWDRELVKSVGTFIRQHGLQFMWVTNYGANDVIQWQEFGFDLTILYPNYTGKMDFGWDWIDNAAYFAMAYHCGLQLVNGKGILYNKTHFYDYLNRGLPEYRDYMNQAFLVVRFDHLDIKEIYLKNHQQYEDIYRFVKRIYTAPKN